MPENRPLLLSLDNSNTSEECARYFCRGKAICVPGDDLRVSVVPRSVGPISLPLFFTVADLAVPVNVVRVLLRLFGYDANGDRAFPSTENVAAEHLLSHPCHLAFFPLTLSNAPDLPTSPVFTPVLITSDEEEDDHDSDVPPPLEPLLGPVNHPESIVRSRRRRHP